MLAAGRRRVSCVCPTVLMQLLQSGGSAVLDELSLARQCPIGENIVTAGHNLPLRSMCVCEHACVL